MLSINRQTESNNVVVSDSQCVDKRGNDENSYSRSRNKVGSTNEDSQYFPFGS